MITVGVNIEVLQAAEQGWVCCLHKMILRFCCLLCFVLKGGSGCGQSLEPREMIFATLSDKGSLD